MSYQVSCNRYHLGLVSSMEKNTVDRGAWWAAVYGVAQSWTRLKQLSMHACTGEGNGNPLRYSYLENTVDRGAWWAAFYGVTQSRTQLKRLSSSSILQSCQGHQNQGTSEKLSEPQGDQEAMTC